VSVVAASSQGRTGTCVRLRRLRRRRGGFLDRAGDGTDLIRSGGQGQGQEQEQGQARARWVSGESVGLGDGTGDGNGTGAA
jgi:hypothetical protein